MAKIFCGNIENWTIIFMWLKLKFLNHFPTLETSPREKLVTIELIVSSVKINLVRIIMVPKKVKLEQSSKIRQSTNTTQKKHNFLSCDYVIISHIQFNINTLNEPRIHLFKNSWRKFKWRIRRKCLLSEFISDMIFRW